MNVDETYGQTGSTFGPDEVGKHRESDSPYGVRDMQGNALEIVRSTHQSDRFRGKGGSWYYDLGYSGRLSTTEILEADSRAPYLGLRVCADQQNNGERR